MNTEPHDPEIQKILNPLKPVPERERLAAVRGRGRFLAQAAMLRNTQPIPQRQRGFFRKEKLIMVATFLVILALLFGGTGMTAYAAQDSLPGEALYPVKTLVEDARLGLTTDPAAEYALLGQYLSTRFAELEALNASGTPLHTAFANRLLLQLDQMLRLAASQSDTEMVENLSQLRNRLEEKLRLNWETPPGEYNGELNGNSETDRLRAELVNRHRVIENAIEDPGEFREALQNNRPETSTPGGGPGPGQPGGSSTESDGTLPGLSGTAQPPSPGEGGSGNGQKGNP